MSILSMLARKGMYYVAHPVLRAARRLLPQKESARILLAYGNEVLLVRNIGVGRWSLPGGAFSKNETAEACALRELKEELSITDAKMEYRLGTYHSHGEGLHNSVHIFVAQARSLHHKKAWEIDEARWFALNDLPSNLSPATARRIGEYKNNLRDVSSFW